MKAIEVKNLEKSYGETKAIDKISFEVNENELFGFIGPDGAGKTTILRILTTLIIPDKGTATIFGFDSVADYEELRLMLGYMPGKFSLYQDLSVEENLTFFATIFGTTIDENYELIKDIYSHIEPFKNRLSGKLSGGMKQKLALSCALIHKPRVLILDEPTTGVDAVSRKEFWQMLKNLQKKGITIIVSTPYMDEASVCDRVALIQNGKIMKINTPEIIISQYEHQLLAIKSNELYRLKNDLNNYTECRSAHLFGQEIHYSSSKQSNIEELTNYIKKNNHTNIDIKPVQPGIEDCFMDLMQLNETLNS